MIQLSNQMRLRIEGGANQLRINSRDQYFVEIEKRLRLAPLPLDSE